jgi:hypothetical protein
MAPRKQNPSNQNDPPVVLPGAINPPPTGGVVTGSTEGYTGVSPGYIPPPRPGVQGKDTVSGIVDTEGAVTPYYNLNTGPRELLNSMGEVERNTFLRNLYGRGWYKSGRPGGGLSDEDEAAVSRLFYASNLAGISWNQIYSSGKKSPFSSSQDGGGRVRVAATEDLVEIANRTALSTIGRKLSASEASKFSRAYQSSQQAEAAGGATVPSTDVFFKNRIEQKYGAESDGYKYLSAISNVANLMENM